MCACTARRVEERVEGSLQIVADLVAGLVGASDVFGRQTLDLVERRADELDVRRLTVGLDAAPTLRIVKAWTDAEPGSVDRRELLSLGRRLSATDPTDERGGVSS